MLVLEYKLRTNQSQQSAIVEAIRTARFIRNAALRYWMDNQMVRRADLQSLCARLAKEHPFAARLNSMARQASADRAWQSIARFYANCQVKKSGKKGFPRFQKDNRSVEYKTLGWKLESDGKRLTFTDGHGIGTVRLIGTRSLESFPLKQIKRVRLLRRADGFYVQFAIQADGHIDHQLTDHAIGIDVGLKAFYTDSLGNTVANPRHLRSAEKRLKRLQRRVSKKRKGSANRRQAVKRLARQHLKVQRRRKDFACKAARALVQSHDLVAFEDLQIAGLLKNHHLAKSIADASWGLFLRWVHYYGRLHGISVIAIPARFTTQDCFGCGERVKKSLSIRTHVCHSCGLVLDRDQNAALNILERALRTAGQAGTSLSQEGQNASGQMDHYLVPAMASGKSAG